MRLVTRSDFDGLVCAVLLKEAGVIDDMKFVHPKDIQDGKVEVTSNDVLTNVPYLPGCGLWFDHHSSEAERGLHNQGYEGCCMPAPSCARVIYDYYGGKGRFGRLDELMAAVDKYDSGLLDRDDVLQPKGWILLAFVMDPRTNLGRYHDYRISNYELMADMIEYCRTKTAAEILRIPDVEARVARYIAHEPLFREFLKARSTVRGNVLVTDLRGAEETPCGNRFVIYALYPEPNISIRVIDGRGRAFCVFAVGHNIFNRTSKTDVGSLMLRYGGGGHERAGTCQVPYDQADRVLQELVAQMNKDG